MALEFDRGMQLCMSCNEPLKVNEIVLTHSIGSMQSLPVLGIADNVGIVWTAAIVRFISHISGKTFSPPRIQVS